ncbi:DUF6907 domain-containing protein [Streptomyces shenzhenensis]|uniref:DUF6907 domain-containing protein n=1 Tax=Streptomyces shenzhenensis TaxID=943815 RepID=UPI00341051D1
MTDPDTGQPMLLLSRDASLGDLQVATTDQAITGAAMAHAAIGNALQLALDYQASTQQRRTEQPRTWTIADSLTGMPLKGTCMSGCSGFHVEWGSGQADAKDFSCTQYDQANTTELPIGCGGDSGKDGPTLSVEIKSYPVHPDEAMRIPHAAVEVTEDHYIEDLDPNGLAAVIDKLEQRVAAMRVRHAELVRIRNEYLGRQA